MKNLTKLALIAVAVTTAASTTGCSAAMLDAAGSSSSSDHKVVHVQASSPYGEECWSGSFGSRTVDGCGDQDVTVDGFVASAVVQRKNAITGTLHLTLTDSSGKVLDDQTTTAEYGVVSVTG